VQGGKRCLSHSYDAHHQAVLSRMSATVAAGGVPVREVPVPDLPAKPVFDLMAAVPDPDALVCDGM
jgi:hypothetical protein